MRRFPVAIALVAALAVPSAAVVGLSGTAGAAVLGTSCAKLTGNASTNVTLSACSPKLATYASATGKSAALLNGGTLTWSTSKKTTVIAKPTVTSVTPNKCASGSAEEKAVGKITGGTATYTKKGETFTAFVCVASTGALSLAPGTKATF